MPSLPLFRLCFRRVTDFLCLTVVELLCCSLSHDCVNELGESVAGFRSFDFSDFVFSDLNYEFAV